MAGTETVACSTCELHAEAVFRVEGMDCNEEVVILERRLKPLVGLEALSADLIGQRLHVKYDAAKLTTSAMVDAVGQTGMRMWLEHEEPAAYGADVTRRWRLVVACAVAIGAGPGGGGGGACRRPPPSCSCWPPSPVPCRRSSGRSPPSARARSTSTCSWSSPSPAPWRSASGSRAPASCSSLPWRSGSRSGRWSARGRRSARSSTSRRARRWCGAGTESSAVAVEDVRIGEEIVLRPGDKVPLDGVVVEGRSDVNEAPLTGESLPIDKAAGDEVYAGTINGHGALEVRVTRLVRDTRLARIIHLVETAQASRAPVQSFVDRFARWYTPAVIVFARGHRAGSRGERRRGRGHLALSRARAARDRLPVRAGHLDARSRSCPRCPPPRATASSSRAAPISNGSPASASWRSTRPAR